MVGNKAQKAVAAALTGLLAFGSVAPALAGVQEDGGWYRINGDHTESWQMQTSGGAATSMSGTVDVEGKNRYDTMWDAINYNVANGIWDTDDTNDVVIASGSSQADALVASSLAGKLDDDNYIGAPVILTKSDELVTQAKRILEYYSKTSDGKDKADESVTVYIVGGTAAISEDVEAAIEDVSDAIYVERIAGANRAETSLKAMQYDNWLEDTNDANVFVANGWAWADALSVSSFAYSNDDMALLLTGSDGQFTADQLDYLQSVADNDTVSIDIVGGPATASIDQLVGNGFARNHINQSVGANRYETSAMVVEDLKGRVLLGGPLAVANGSDAHWADALIGGPFVGANWGVLVLVDGVDEVTALSQAYKDQKDLQLSEFTGDKTVAPKFSYIIGGEEAISKVFAKKLGAKFPAQS